jgi:hypothetical protein
MTDPSMAALLQQALTGGPAAQESLRQAMAQHEDPRVRMLAEWAAQQRHTDEGVTVDVEAETIEEQPSDPVRERRMQRKIRALTAELEFQREIGDTLAAALGACYLCWGDDPECEQCGGVGSPGWNEPDPELFAGYILPAINRIRKRRNASAASRTRDQQPNPFEPDTERSPS